MFAIIDHATGEAWCDASLRMDRFAAADLLREACAERFGSVERAVCQGLALRYDGGAVLSSPALPGGDRPPRHRPLAGLPLRARDQRLRQKFIPKLKEQVLWIERFATHEELREAVRAFARTYNREWLLERHGYLSPLEARERMLAQEAVA